MSPLPLGLSWLNVGLWLSGMVAIAFLPIDPPNTAGFYFTIFYALAAPSSSLLVVGWIAWIGDFGWLILTPDNTYWMCLIWARGGAMATGHLLASFNPFPAPKLSRPRPTRD